MTEAFSFEDANKPSGFSFDEARKPFSFEEAVQTEPGFFEKQITTPLKQGIEQFASGAGAAGAKAYQDRLKIFDQIDAAAKTGDTKAVQAITDLYPDTEIKQYAGFGIAKRPDKQAAIRQQYEQYIQAGTGRTAAAESELAKYPPDQAIVELQNAKTWGDWGRIIYQNPGLLTRTLIQSAPSMVQGIGMTPVLGPAGLGMGDMGAEMGSTLVDTMRGAGVDVTDQAAMRQALLNPELMKQARERMNARGLAVGAFDTLTAGIASKALLPERMMKRASGKAAELALQTGVQAAGGAAGEATGQIASQGKITSPTDVLMEAIAEIPGGAVEAAVLGAQAGKYRTGDKGPLPASAADLEGLLSGTGEEVHLPADAVRLNVDLRNVIPSERPINLGPNEELPIESQFQTTGVRPMVKAGEAQQRTADFFGKGGLVEPGIPSGKKAYSTPRVDEIPAGDLNISNAGNPQLEAVRRAADREQQSLASRLAALPGVRGLTVGAARVTGDAKAVALARRASLLNTQATQAKAEGRIEDATRLRQQAAQVLEKATVAGFSYLEPLEHTLDATVRAGVTGVARPGAPQPTITPRLDAMTRSQGRASPAFQSKETGEIVAGTPSDTHGTVYVANEEKLKSGNYLSGFVLNGKFMAREDLPKGERTVEERAAKTKTPKRLKLELSMLPSPEEIDANPNLAPETREALFRAVKGMSRAKLLEQAGKKNEAKGLQQQAEQDFNLALQNGFRPRGLEQRTDEQGTQGGVGPKSAFTQDPTVFDNPLVMLEAGLDRAATPQGANLWSMGPTKGLSAVVGFVRSLQRRLLPNLKLIIDTRPDSFFASPGANGTYVGFRGDWGVIWLPESTMNDPAKAATVLSHELGHALIHQHWSQTDTATQQAIYAAFGRHIATSFGPEATAATFLNDLHSPITLAIVQKVYEGNLTKPSMDFLQDSHYGSWWSFDEWIAEQASKWMFTNRRTVTLLDRFFKSLGNAIEKVLRTLGRNLETFQPPVEVKAWLDSLLERRALGQGPLTAPGTLDSYRKGLEKNALVLDEPVSFNIAPPQAENIGLRTLAMKIPGLLKDKHIAQADRWGWMSKHFNGLLQIAANNPHIVGLQSYLELARTWNISKMGIISKADSRLKAWRKLGKETARGLSNLLFDVDGMVYLKEGENARWPTTQELISLAQKYRLNRKAVELYMAIRGDYLDILDRVHAAWLKDAQASIQNPTNLQAAVAQVNSEIAAMKSKPYFPHSRWGDWTVSVKDKDGKMLDFSQWPDRRAAIRAAKGIQGKYPGAIVSSGKLAEEVKIFRGLPPTIAKGMGNKLNLTREQRDDLDKLIFDLSPANSFAKQWKQRKGTPGFSLDGMRAYASYFLHAGGHIARLEHGAELQLAVQDVAKSARAMTGIYAANEAGKRQGLADWMQRHLDYIMNPREEWNAVRSATFLWYLGFNVSSAAINLTQVPLVAYPYLAARHGDLRALNELRRAGTDIHKMYGLKSKLAPDERDAISLGITHGFLDEAQAAELAGAAQTGVLNRLLPGNSLSRTIMQVSHWGSFMFGAVEKLNRRVVFRAAYRLAKQNPGKYTEELTIANGALYKSLLGSGWTPTNAAAFLAARDAVERTQFEYAQWARPQVMRGRVGTLLTFWQFKTNMLWFMKNSPGAGRAWLILLLAAGFMGLPGASDLDKFVTFAASRMGKNFSPERELREMVSAAGGSPDLFAHGLSRESFGLTWLGDMLGVPMPGLDLSGRIGMGNVLPIGEALTTKQTSFEERLGSAAEAILGASYGVPLNILKSIESNDPDVFKQWERALPTAAKNLAKAVRLAQAGKETTRSGATVAEFDVLDSTARAELIAQSLGFTPTRLTKAWDEAAEKREAVGYWITRRAELYDQFATAQRAKDREGLADARGAIQEYNKSVPDGKLRITADTLRKSLKARARARRSLERDDNPIERQIAPLYQ